MSFLWKVPRGEEEERTEEGAAFGDALIFVIPFGLHGSQTKALRGARDRLVVADEVTRRGPAPGEEEQCQQAKRAHGGQHALLCKL